VLLKYSNRAVKRLPQLSTPIISHTYLYVCQLISHFQALNLSKSITIILLMIQCMYEPFKKNRHNDSSLGTVSSYNQTNSVPYHIWKLHMITFSKPIVLAEQVQQCYKEALCCKI